MQYLLNLYLPTYEAKHKVETMEICGKFSKLYLKNLILIMIAICAQIRFLLSGLNKRNHFRTFSRNNIHNILNFSL